MTGEPIPQTPLFVERPDREYQPGDIEPVTEVPAPEPEQEIPLQRTLAIAEGARVGKRERLRNLRERFERTYTTWKPFSEAELSMAIEGLTARENKVLGKVSDKTLVLTVAHYKNAEGFKIQADKHALYLRDAKVLEDDPAPSVDRIRNVPEIRDALADYIEALQSMERLKWRQKRGSRKSSGPLPREQEREEILEHLDRKPDDELVRLWSDALLCASTRANFWEMQIKNAIIANELLAGAIKENLTNRA